VCDSTVAMMSSLPRSRDRLRMLRWETFAMQRAKTARKLLEWLGASTNETALEAGLSGTEEEARRCVTTCNHYVTTPVTTEEEARRFRAFKSLSLKFPLSPRSTFLVERRCADAMRWLRYERTVDYTPRSRPAKDEWANASASLPLTARFVLRDHGSRGMAAAGRKGRRRQRHRGGNRSRAAGAARFEALSLTPSPVAEQSAAAEGAPVLLRHTGAAEITIHIASRRVVLKAAGTFLQVQRVRAPSRGVPSGWRAPRPSPASSSGCWHPPPAAPPRARRASRRERPTNARAGA
jgi:hypothetical protein